MLKIKNILKAKIQLTFFIFLLLLLSTINMAQAQLLPRLIANKNSMPGINLQTTQRGTTINTLFPFNGNIYFGYGDYDLNTGPIPILSYNLLTGTFDASFTANTEAIQKFITHAPALGTIPNLYAPSIDPYPGEVTGSAFRFDGSTWSSLPTNIPEAYHVFDAVEFQNKLYFGIAPYYGLGGAIYSTADQGITWVEELNLPLTLATSLCRCYSLGATSTQLFASGYIITSTSLEQFAYTYNGTRWSEITTGLPQAGFLHPVVLNDTLKIVNLDTELGFGGNFLGSYSIGNTGLVPETIFPATAPTPVNWSVQKIPSFSTTVEIMFALQRTPLNTYEIHITNDFITWSIVTKLESLVNDSYSSITYLDNNIYLGTKNGNFYVLENVFAL